MSSLHLGSLVTLHMNFPLFTNMGSDIAEIKSSKGYVTAVSSTLLFVN